MLSRVDVRLSELPHTSAFSVNKAKYEQQIAARSKTKHLCG